MVHSFYSSAQPSGENTVVLNEVDALRRAGHEVALFAAHTDELEGEVFYKLRAGMRVATGYGRNPLKAINGFSPDVVHVHNLFPNYGRRWVESLEVPVVHTLHNYRPICANGLLFRDGEVCTRCPDGDGTAGLRFGCYRDSRLATLPLTIANYGGPTRDPLLRRADRLLVLTDLQKHLYVKTGVPPERLQVHPNFLADEDAEPQGDASASSYVAVGRLSPEKGIRRLAEVWPACVELGIIGDGPDRAAIEALGKPNIRLYGQLTHTATLELVSRSQALIFPSLWFETFGLTALEAWACSTPVVSTPGNTVEAMIRAHGGGIVSTWEELPDLVASAAFTEDDRAGARRAFEEHYTEDAYLRRAESLYRSLISETA